MTNMQKNQPTIFEKPPLTENQIIQRLSLVSIIGNTILSGFKMIAGISGRSGAMISDAVHSFSDVLTTVIAYFGVKISKKEADKAHPYGHDRLECVASLILGLMLLLTGLAVGGTGLKNIVSGHYDTLAVPGAIAFIAAIVSILSKEAMYWYTRHYAKLIHSNAFMADAWHHRSDAFSSVGSLLGIAGAMAGFPVLDSAAGVVICLFILKVSYDILKDAVKKMLDTSCGEDYEAKLRGLIEAQPGVECINLLRTRMFGNKVYIDLEIEADGDESLREGHAVAQHVHDTVEAEFADIKHIMIHVNPTEVPVD